jgi:4-hydroxy-tetrahydrodipicolinate synthase
MSKQLKGVLTALATPFTADGALDQERLRALVDRSIDGGVHGVVACGSTGEFTALSSDERRLVVETVVDQAAGRVPVIAQTGATSTAEAISLSRHAQAAGADVIMPVAPYYEALSLDETLDYLRTVAGSVDIPVMLYNLPMATGVNLEPETVGSLAREVQNILYIKNTTTDMAQSAQLIHNHGDVISTFVGWDSLLFSALTEGAAGVMAGTANVVPAQLVSVYDAIQTGDLHAARQEWERIYPLIDAIISAPFIPAVKAALDGAGFPVGAPRKPVHGLDQDTAAKIKTLAAKFQAAHAASAESR